MSRVVTGSVDLLVILPDGLQVFGCAGYRATAGRAGCYDYPEEPGDVEFTDFSVSEWEYLPAGCADDPDNWVYVDAVDCIDEPGRIVGINNAACIELNGDPGRYDSDVWEAVAENNHCEE